MVNNKGFAVSGIVYSILILFFLLIFGVLGVMGSRKLILDKMKNEIINELNNEVSNNIYIDDSGANYPRLVNQMIPVIYDNEQSSWIYADIYEKWYDYDEKMWANAIVLKNGVTKTVGQKITEDEIALMYVWIPRYKYVMFNAHNEGVDEQVIDIVFENNTNSTGTVKCIDAINQIDENGNKISEICTDTMNGDIVNHVSTYTHPAFTFGDEEIEGFWVGKFENSTTDSECLGNASSDTCNKDTHIIEIKANSDSLRYVNISNMFTSVQNISNNYGINDADSHMIKNMEWGAVAYLTQSKYGQGMNELRNNNNNNYTTGCAASSQNEAADYAKCQNTYNTQVGLLASTTANIYGVYDMSGGAEEYVMGFINNTNNDDLNILYSSNINSKYYDIYTNGTSAYDYTRGILGDATKEIIGWNSDSNYFVENDLVWFRRGGHFVHGSGSGIFTFDRISKVAVDYYSSRSVLIKK